MTDNEIIKALECCKENEDRRNCDNWEQCPAAWCDLKDDESNCLDVLCGRTLDLIKRQQKEIDRLKTEKDNLIKTYAECQVDFLKEFVKKLKEDIQYRIDATGDYELYEVFQDIDNLVEEMGCGE